MPEELKEVYKQLLLDLPERDQACFDNDFRRQGDRSSSRSVTTSIEPCHRDAPSNSPTAVAASQRCAGPLTGAGGCRVVPADPETGYGHLRERKSRRSLRAASCRANAEAGAVRRCSRSFCSSPSSRSRSTSHSSSRKSSPPVCRRSATISTTSCRLSNSRNCIWTPRPKARSPTGTSISRPTFQLLFQTINMAVFGTLIGAVLRLPSLLSRESQSHQ